MLEHKKIFVFSVNLFYFATDGRRKRSVFPVFHLFAFPPLPIFVTSRLRLFCLSPLRSMLSAHLPMDQAKGILEYIQAKLPDKNYDVDGVMSDLVRYTRKPETLSEEIVNDKSGLKYRFGSI